MRQPDPRRFDRWPIVFAGSLLLCACLAGIPASWASSMREYTRGLLVPGLNVSRAAIDWISNRQAESRAWSSRAGELLELRQRVDRLEAEKLGLERELTSYYLRRPGWTNGLSDSDATQLLRPRLVEARVLGQQARLHLDRTDLLECGTSSGIVTDAWVLSSDPVLLDQGCDRNLTDDALVLAEASESSTRSLSRGADVAAAAARRCVWGKIVRAGPRTSSARRVNAPGYRDLVQLASLRQGELRYGPRGVWEGTGERECRIKLIEASQPVSVGDLVLTANEQGLLPQPLSYGEVTRVEHPPGATHWEIWVLPAAADAWLDRVAVLVAEKP